MIFTDYLNRSADFRNPGDFIEPDIAFALVLKEMAAKGLLPRVPLEELRDHCWALWGSAGGHRPTVGEVLDAIVAMLTEDGTLSAPSPVGLSDIARRFHVKPQTAYQWKYRGLLPEPRWVVSGQPAWDANDITTWAASRLGTGRAPFGDRGEQGAG